MIADSSNGLDLNIGAALDEVLVPDACDSALLGRLRRLIENCLADNYDQSDVLAVIELGMEKCGEGEVSNGA